MGDDRIEELLAKVRKLDPETDEAYSWLGMQLPFEIDQKVLEYVRQGVIQEAAKAKKWHHDVCYNEETEKYVSLVVPADNETWLDSVEADTAVEAILTAFVAALEAEANR